MIGIRIRIDASLAELLRLLQALLCYDVESSSHRPCLRGVAIVIIGDLSAVCKGQREKAAEAAGSGGKTREGILPTETRGGASIVEDGLWCGAVA